MAVGRTTISLISTASGWLIAKAIVSARVSTEIAISCIFLTSSATAVSVTLDGKSVSTGPGEIMVLRCCMGSSPCAGLLK